MVLKIKIIRILKHKKNKYINYLRILILKLKYYFNTLSNENAF